MYFYHGADGAVQSINPARKDAAGVLLSASASVNVALRYGPVISKFRLIEKDVLRLKIKDWFSNPGGHLGADVLRARGYSAVVLEGEWNCFDFPVDTVFVLHPRALEFVAVLNSEEVNAMDDGVTARYEPNGPSDRGWMLFVNDVYQGDLQEALSTLDWRRDDNGAYSIQIPADSLHRKWLGMVSQTESGRWLAEHNFCTDTVPFDKLEDALARIDLWRKEETSSRRETNRRLQVTHPNRATQEMLYSN